MQRILLCLATTSGLLLGQDLQINLTPAPHQNQGQAQAQATNKEAKPAADTANKPASEEKKAPLLGGVIPSLDPGSETVLWDGNAWNVTNQRVFGARFEKYLNAPAADSREDNEYRKTLRSILDALSPNQPGHGDINKAVGLLPAAASYYSDARLCESIANAVYGVYLARRNVAALKKANEFLGKEMDRLSWNAALASAPDRLDKEPTQGERGRNGAKGDVRGNNNSNSGNSATLLPDPANTLRAAREGEDTQQQRGSQGIMVGRYLRQYAEYEAQALSNKTAIMVSEPQQKIEFQSLILQLFLQRRFEHVIISSRIYRVLFSDGDSQLHLKDGSDAQRLVRNALGFSPTINMLDAFSNEAIRDVDEGVQAFDHLVSKQELEGAAKRLSEAFAVGEYLPRVRTVPVTKKERVIAFVRHSNQLLSALEAKDYQLAQTLVDQMKAEAKDFDYAKAESAIKTFVGTANMALNQAMLAARNGDDKALKEHLKTAHELYPTNPELRKVSEQIVKGKDVQDQALNDLDRLVAEGNYRAIQKDEGRFAAAASLSADPKRLESLNTLRQTIQELRMGMEKAKALADSGAVEGAWETLRQIEGKFRQDPDFNELYSKLTVKAAGFVHDIEKADQHLEKDQLGSSLAWYLKARKTHARSVLAEQGIEKIVAKLLRQPGEAESAKAAVK